MLDVDKGNGAAGRLSDDNILPLVFRHLGKLIFLTAIAALVLAVVLRNTVNLPFAYFMRDPIQTADLRPFAGFISQLGIMAWTASSAIAMLGAALVSRFDTEPHRVRFLLLFGVLTATLAADDTFIIHESVPFSEFLLFAFYGASLFAIVYFSARILIAHHGWLLLLAVLALGGSVLVDQLQHSLEPILGDWRIFVEDGLKLLGAFLWLVFIWNAACSIVLSLLSDASPRVRSS